MKEIKKSTSEIIKIVKYSTPPLSDSVSQTQHAYSQDNSTDKGRSGEKEYKYSQLNMESIFHIEYNRENSSRCPCCGYLLVNNAKTHKLDELRFLNTQDSPTNLERKLTVMSGIFEVKYTQDNNNPKPKFYKGSHNRIIRRVKKECSENPLIIIRGSSRSCITNLLSHKSVIEDHYIPRLFYNDCQDKITREKGECEKPLIIIRCSSTSCKTNLPSHKTTRGRNISHIKSCSQTFPDIESEYFVRSTEYSFRNKLEDDLKWELLKEYFKSEQKRNYIYTYSSSSKEILNDSDEFPNKGKHEDPTHPRLTRIQCCMQTNTSSGKLTKSMSQTTMQTCCDCECNCDKKEHDKSESAKKSEDPHSTTLPNEASSKQSDTESHKAPSKESNKTVKNLTKGENSKKSYKTSGKLTKSMSKIGQTTIQTCCDCECNCNKKEHGKSESAKKSEDPHPTTLPNEASSKQSNTESHKAPSKESYKTVKNLTKGENSKESYKTSGQEFQTAKQFKTESQKAPSKESYKTVKNLTKGENSKESYKTSGQEFQTANQSKTESQKAPSKESYKTVKNLTKGENSKESYKTSGQEFQTAKQSKTESQKAPSKESYKTVKNVTKGENSKESYKTSGQEFQTAQNKQFTEASGKEVNKEADIKILFEESTNSSKKKLNKSLSEEFKESSREESNKSSRNECCSSCSKENEFYKLLNDASNVESYYKVKAPTRNLKKDASQSLENESFKLETLNKAKDSLTLKKKPQVISKGVTTSSKDPEKSNVSSEAKPKQNLKGKKMQTTKHVTCECGTQDMLNSNQIMDQQDIVINNPISIIIKGGRVLIGSEHNKLNEHLNVHNEKKQLIEPSEHKEYDESIENERNKRNTSDKNNQVVGGNRNLCECPNKAKSDIIGKEDNYYSKSCQCQFMEHTISSESQTESVGDRKYQPKRRAAHVNKFIQSVCNHDPPCKQVPGCFLRENVDFLNYCAHVPVCAKVSLFVCEKSRNNVVSSMPLTKSLSTSMANFKKTRTSTLIKRVRMPDTVQVMRVSSPIIAVQTSEEELEVIVTSTDDQQSDVQPELPSPVQPLTRATCPNRSKLSSNFGIVTRKATFWGRLSKIFGKRKRK